MLICDKRRPRTQRGPISGPQRGPNKNNPGLRPAPRALLGVGRRAPAPWAAPPGAPSRTGPLLPRHPAGGFRARVRRWRGWATACGCPCPTPSPWRFSGFGEIQRWAVRSAAGGSGACPRCRGDGGQPGPGGGRPGCSRRLPAVHRLGEVVHGRPGSRRSGSSEQSNRANIFSFCTTNPRKAAPVLGFKRTTV